MNQHTLSSVNVAVILTVTHTAKTLEQIYAQLSQELINLEQRYEFIIVENLDQDQKAGIRATVSELQRRNPGLIRLLSLPSVFTESDALVAAFSCARATNVLVVPAYSLFDFRQIQKLLRPLAEGNDLVSAWRVNRKDSLLIRIQSRIFNGLVRRLIGLKIHDLGCGVMAMRREVAESLDIYGDMFRFIPVLAFRHGFQITEVPLEHVVQERKRVFYGPGTYVRRLLDIATIFFLVKFTKKPLRFFGLSGSAVFFMGTIVNMYLSFHKFLGNPIANRPLLILGTLFMVLGIQLVSIGLVGELIIFTHARKLKEYLVEKILIGGYCSHGNESAS